MGANNNEYHAENLILRTRPEQVERKWKTHIWKVL